MRGYLGESIIEKDPLQIIVPQNLIQESTELPVEVVESMWEMKDSPERLVRIFNFKDLTARNWFLAEILEKRKIKPPLRKASS